MLIRKSASKLLCSECTEKVYEESGLEIPFHKFPEDRDLFTKWIVAIRRDVGRDGNNCFHAVLHSRREQTPWAARPWQPLFSNHKSERFLTVCKVALLWRILCSYHLDIAAKTSTLNFLIDWDLSFKWRRYSWKFYKWKRFQQFWGMIFGSSSV